MKFCIKCGHKALPAAQFCGHCGVAIHASEKNRSRMRRLVLVAPAVIVAGMLMVMIAIVAGLPLLE